MPKQYQHKRNNPGRHGRNQGRRRGGRGPTRQNLLEEITAPYNFVPLADRVFLPDWGEQVSHDRPLADGYCGTVELNITSHTHILPGEPDRQGVVHHFTLPDGRLAIPGSTLRGMVRNVLEIASFGKMGLVDDRRLAIRDLTAGARKIYGKKFTCPLNLNGRTFFKSTARAGWLFYDTADKVWKISPCKYARVEQSELRNAMSPNGWVRTRNGRDRPTAEEKYTAWLAGNGSLSVKFSHTGQQSQQARHRRSGRNLYYDFATLGGSKQGYLVFTGQPSPKKHMEFIFFDAGEPIEVEPSVIRDFRAIYDPAEGDGNDHFRYLRMHQHLFDNKGIPVFYLTGADGRISAIGLSQMFKLPYRFSIGELIDKACPSHRDAGTPDLAELIFGLVDEDEGRQSLKGRVSFSCAVSEKKREEVPFLEIQTILNSPKPSYYPNYIEQDHHNGKLQGQYYSTYMDYDARIRGWKRYPVRLENQVSHVEPQQGQGKSVQCSLRPVTDPVTYQGRMRFHNLKAEELGALLWALTWGGERRLRHALGMGKPFGYGQISIEVLWEKSEIIPNRPAGAWTKPLMADFRARYTALMEKEVPGWHQSDQLRQLMAMADPEQAKGRELNHMELKDQYGDNQFNLAKGAKNNAKLVLKPYAIPRGGACNTGSRCGPTPLQDRDAIPDDPWLRETVNSLTEQHKTKARQVMLGKLLAEAWQAIDKDDRKAEILKLIRAYWQQHQNGGWDGPHSGRSAKRAAKIYAEWKGET